MTELLDSPVVEHAVLTVPPSMAAEFEQSFAAAVPLIACQPGFRGLRLLTIHETPGRYVLLVGWVSVKAHEVGFRQSREYDTWRTALHHFYDPMPTVEHAAVVASG